LDPVTLALSIINQALILYNGLPVDVKNKQAEAWQSIFDKLAQLAGIPALPVTTATPVTPVKP
jgi:hypothetical protein